MKRRPKGYQDLESILEGYALNREPSKIQSTYVPPGFYRNWTNVEAALKKITEQKGHFPSARELHKMREFSLLNAIVTHHGGVNHVRQKLGHERANESKYKSQEGLEAGLQEFWKSHPEYRGRVPPD